MNVGSLLFWREVGWQNIESCLFTVNHRSFKGLNWQIFKYFPKSRPYIHTSLEVIKRFLVFFYCCFLMFLEGSLPAQWDKTHTHTHKEMKIVPHKGPNYVIENVSTLKANHRRILNLDLQKWFLNIVYVGAHVYYFEERCYNFHQCLKLDQPPAPE